eukprot:gene12121-8344_t
MASAKPLAPGLSPVPIKRDRHPAWHPPEATPAAAAPSLQLLNSLTETVEPFHPANPRMVTWYTCGPTVYDDAHMGHARAYLTFDILRRVLEDYFGYPVLYQMNITDIDDKIIQRARVNKLWDDFTAALEKDSTPAAAMEKLKTIAGEATEAIAASLADRRAKLSEALPPNANSRAKQDREEKLKELKLKECQLTETRIKVEKAIAANCFPDLLKAACGPVGDLLDKREGHRIADPKIFEDHARKYERSFFNDMRRLGIRAPDVVSRVTEYVPQVVDFVQKIMDNGFAYKGKTSVFFDTEAYKKAGHNYPKLKPQADGEGAANTTEDEMAEGEGGLSKAEANEKRSPNDFALWKFSKAGEPRWPSPWGDGRPGWHIECSVMASDILGKNFDIHGGGSDLKFPHHDNECAQSEACHMQHQWVNYFLHCGHLHIKGLKMSKSLKNFITIDQALGELGVTPRLMRLLFLANNWNKAMNFSDQSLDEARERERVLRAFFGSVEAVLRSDPWSSTQGANEQDRELLQHWKDTENNVHRALLDNIDTPTALNQLLNLVSVTNQYLLSGQRPSLTILRKVARYVTRMFQVFGVVEGTDNIGFAAAGGQKGGEDGERLVAVVDALVGFRDVVRDAARELKVMPAFLPACDRLRDDQLVEAGIRLEDKPNGPTTWKYDDPAAMKREREEREQQAASEKLKKAINQAGTKAKLIAKWEQVYYEPVEFFRIKEADKPEGERKYSSFDPASGLPVKTVSGEDVSEKEQKKLAKEQSKYTSLYDEFQKKGGTAWLDSEKAQLKELEETVLGYIRESNGLSLDLPLTRSIDDEVDAVYS